MLVACPPCSVAMSAYRALAKKRLMARSVRHTSRGLSEIYKQIAISFRRSTIYCLWNPYQNSRILVVGLIIDPSRSHYRPLAFEHPFESVIASEGLHGSSSFSFSKNLLPNRSTPTRVPALVSPRSNVLVVVVP